MPKQTKPLDSSILLTDPTEIALHELKQEYEHFQELFNAQPGLVQRYMETQAASVAEAIIQDLPQVRFALPDRVVISSEHASQPVTIPADQREQMAGGLMDRLTRVDLRTTLRQRLLELEGSSNQAVSVAAALFRFVLSIHMVHNMLPAGRTVVYQAAQDGDIPNVPAVEKWEPESAITASTDAIAEESQAESGRGELLVPYVEAARHFFLPQWVAFDDRGTLLVGSTGEAEAHLASMQRYLFILHAAIGMSPYMVADEQYQQKRYGILGQLVNQGRALARYEIKEIIRTIKRRAAANDLNRGLSLSLPYFNDQKLDVDTYFFEIIPAGRIMFVPAFVVRAAREQVVKVVQDTRFNASTRKHLLEQLRMIEKAFEAG
jgi:hypothetical protein